MEILDFLAYSFDFDGVVINSEKTHYECYKKALKIMVNYELSWNDYCKIHHSIDTSFELLFPNDFEKIYKFKKDLYKAEICNIELMEGFLKFFNILLKYGKYICIVTDASREIFDLFCIKFPFLKKCNIIITREDVDKRKPDSSCYLKLLQKLNQHISLHDIIAFEDSYKGWVALYNSIYNCVLVNSSDYLYYKTINPDNSITNFNEIVNIKFNQRFKFKPFYISSKTSHREKWLTLNKIFPIIANWITVNKSKEFIRDSEKNKLCDSIHNDINNSEFGILYLEKNEKDHIGSLIEIGMLLAKSKKIYVCGNNLFKNEVLFNFNEYFNFSFSENFDLIKTFRDIQYDMSLDYSEFKKNTTAMLNSSIFSKSLETTNNNIIDYIVICASGKGSRLLPITKHIPKLLVNLDSSTVLTKIINYWKKYCNKFIVVIDSTYNKLVDFYLKLSNIQYEIINVDCVNGEENSYTLNVALKDDKFYKKKILITWCDIFPESFIPDKVFGNENVIFTYKNLGRYEAFNNSIIKKPCGNVIGIYYFCEFKRVKIFEPKMDICDCYKINFNDFTTYEIEKLADIGDYSKLCDYISKNLNCYKTRYFNKITEVSNEFIKKQSTSVYGEKIITNEMAFYKYHNIDNIPEILEFGQNFFIMKKIANAKNAIEIFNSSTVKNQLIFIKGIINELDKIHNTDIIDISEDKLKIDIKIEFYEKVLQRIENIEPLLLAFNKVISVNSVIIKYSHNFIINEMYKRINSHFIGKFFKYQLIHGDPHLSNILVGDNNKLWFIDPRGYFGNTKLFGLKEYDLSKIIYSLSGFDEINNNDNHFFIIDEKDNISVNITNNIDNYLDLFKDCDKDILICMTILHWFGLTDYSKNNIHKCISSYFYGIYLYHHYFINKL
jgi:beta-phosphoglucomutase-like phosphatase (HAD superfamily)